MKVVYYFFISIILLSNSINLKAQEMLGVISGNYSGTASMLINPAMLTNTHYFIDVNLASADVFFHNNAVYIPGKDYNMIDAIKTKDLPQYGEDKNNFLYYDNKDPKILAQNIRVLGPSVMFQWGDHAFGISTAARVFSSGTNVSWEIPIFGYESLKYKELQNILFNDYNTDFQSNAWGEIGLSYAYNLVKYFDHQLTVGVTAKYLLGYSGAYADVNNMEYIVQDDSTINITNLDAKLGYTLPLDYDNNDFPDNGSTIKGKGFGFDLGVVYVKRKSIDNKRWNKVCEQEYNDYIYRIGVSLLDIGGITYKTNTQVHSYDNVNALWENYDDLTYDNLNQVVQEISNVLYDNPDASLEKTSMKIGLPTALSIQADYHINKNIFIGGLLIQPIRINQHTLRRPAQLAITPRFETKFLEFALPISLYEYQYPRIGASLRLYFLTIGTDRIGTWLGTSNLDGMDLYVSVKIGFGKGSCRQKSHNACYNGEYGYSKKQKKLFRKR